MRALNVLLAVTISAVMAFLAFELGLRIIPAFRPQESLNEFDARLGWVKRPNARVTRTTGEFSVTFETNAQGLRDEPRASIEKSPNTFRVMMLGDSFVLGYTVDREDLFVDHLRHLWVSQQRRVDVVNAGTEGYSTDQEALWFQEAGKDYAPDLVILFPYENDVYWNGQERYNRYPKPRYSPDGVLATGALVDPGELPWAQTHLATAKFAGFLASRLARPSGVSPHHFLPSGGGAPIPCEFAPLLPEAQDEPFLVDAYARTEGALRALKASCDAIGARLLMVPLPSDRTFYADERVDFAAAADGLNGLPAERWNPERPVDAFLAIGRRLGIETLDVRSTFRARADLGERLYFENEWHLNPAGNLALAEFLRDELDAREVFPATHAALAAGDFERPRAKGGFPAWTVVFAVLWAALGSLYVGTYKDEKAPVAFLKVGGLLALVFAIVLGGSRGVALLPHWLGPWIIGSFVVGILGFVAFKLGRRLATVLELLQAFTLRGHWYLMPLVAVLLTIGSLLVVAASSPLIAPFIYTLF